MSTCLECSLSNELLVTGLLVEEEWRHVAATRNNSASQPVVPLRDTVRVVDVGLPKSAGKLLQHAVVNAG
jgi:hypothetical protein